MTRIALLQMTSGIDPDANARTIVEGVQAAGAGGAAMIFTPEMSGLLDRDRDRAAPHVVAEADNPVLAAVRAAAIEYGLWVALGSLACTRSKRAASATLAWPLPQPASHASPRAGACAASQSNNASG